MAGPGRHGGAATRTARGVRRSETEVGMARLKVRLTEEERLKAERVVSLDLYRSPSGGPGSGACSAARAPGGRSSSCPVPLLQRLSLPRNASRTAN
jgi:hypothetical protein